MKNKTLLLSAIFLLFQSLAPSFARAAWTEESYDQVEDRLNKLTLPEMTDACDEGIDSACQDVLVKLTPKDAFAYEFLVKEDFFAKAEKYCTDQGSRTCAYLMRKIHEEAAHQPNSDAMKAKADQAQIKNCSALADNLKKNQDCISLIPNYTERYNLAVVKKAVTEPNQAEELLIRLGEKENREIIGKICENKEILSAPVCKRYVEEKEEINERNKKGMNQFYLGGLVLAIIAFLGFKFGGNTNKNGSGTNLKSTSSVEAYSSDQGFSTRGDHFKAQNTAPAASSNDRQAIASRPSPGKVIAKYEFNSPEQAERAFLEIKNALPRGVNISGRTVEVTNDCPDPSFASKVCIAHGGF